MKREDPEERPYLEKYLAAANGVSIEDRMRVLRLIENLVAGPGAVGYLIESMHGAGSPQTQKVMYGRLGNLEQKKRWTKRLLRID